MQLYPAIDIKNGQCVRLKQGVFKDVEVYSDEPWEVARKWESLGATFIHVVDLDGALKGRAVNASVIRKIVEAVSCPVQLGGGIRTMEDIEATLLYGVSRVIIGTKAVSSPEFIKEAVERFGSDRIVLGVDAKDGFVAIEGWEKLSDMKALDLCLMMKEYGIKNVVYTDISKDGMLGGPNVLATKKLTEDTGMNIIASGGVSSMEDLNNLYKSAVKGAIIGKALYTDRVNLSEAVRLFEKEQSNAD